MRGVRSRPSIYQWMAFAFGYRHDFVQDRFRDSIFEAIARVRGVSLDHMLSEPANKYFKDMFLRVPNSTQNKMRILYHAMGSSPHTRTFLPAQLEHIKDRTATCGRYDGSIIHHSSTTPTYGWTGRGGESHLFCASFSDDGIVNGNQHKRSTVTLFDQITFSHQRNKRKHFPNLSKTMHVVEQYKASPLKKLLGLDLHPVARYFRDFEESIRFADFRGFLSAKRAQKLLSTNSKVVNFQAIGVRVEAAVEKIAKEMQLEAKGSSCLLQQGANFGGYHFFDHNFVPVGWVFFTADAEERNQIYLTGDKKFIDHFAVRANQELPLESRKVINVKGITPQGLDVEDDFIRLDSVDKAYPEFYPWLDMDPGEYMQKYMESRGSVLLLIGPPGTGKTTFLREFIMTGVGEKQVMITANRKVAVSDELVNRFQRSDADVLVMEDADDATRAREDGNDSMSTLLNVANGVITNNKKIVISTNLDNINKVDPALLRKGRCYDILEFRRLTQEEAVVAFKAARPDDAVPDFSVQADWSIAELLHADHDNNAPAEARKRHTFGFNPNAK